MFTDRLTTTVSLSIGSDVHALIAGQIERFAIDLQVWGFTAEVTFYVSAEQEADPIFEGFSGTALIAVTLTFARETEGDGASPAPLKLTGYAVSKAVLEVVSESLLGSPVIGRRYELRFVDAAQAFWTRHRPLELHVQASMQDMIDANRPTGVAITYDWSSVSTKQAVLTVGLDGEAEPSFYDFLMHWVDRNQGVFELDSQANSYRLGGKKTGSGSPTALAFDDVAQLRLHFPEPPRFTARVLQSFAPAPLTKELPNPLAAGIRRDVVMRTPIAADVSQRAQLETARLRASAPGIEISYKRCPDVLTAPLGFLSVADGFSTRIYPAGTTYRVTRLRAGAAHKPGLPVEPEDVTAVYEIELTVEAEDKSNPVPRLPVFRDPRRTLRVEGTIVSAGQAGQRSWAAIENEDNSLWMYKVQIPLFNKEVPAPFEPNFATGHFFFPAYKDQRVLVDLEFDRATVTGFLDWADEGRLPSASQGSQIVMGFQSSNGTLIRHSYVDAIPVLHFERKASIETSTLTFGDGIFHIGLEQSSAVPTTIPLYDVSPQVEAAKDAVVGEVGGSVTVVTTQFETAVSQVSGSIEEASNAVQVEISSAERKLTAQLDAAQTELQGLLADASAASASLSMGGARCKARLAGAIESVDAIRAPLLELQARLRTFRNAVSLQIKALEAEIATLPDVLAAPLDTLSARAVALRDRAKNRLASLRAAIEALNPRAGAFPELTRFRQAVQGLDADIGQSAVQLDAKLSAFVSGGTAEWLKVDASLTSARSGSRASLERATTQLDAQLTRLDAALKIRLGAASATVRAPLTNLQGRAASLRQSVRAQLDGERTRLDDALAGLTARASQGRTQLKAAADSAEQTLSQTLQAAAATAKEALAALDTAQSALESAASSAVDRLGASVGSLEQAVLPVLDAVPGALQTVKRTLQQAVQAAVDTCNAGLSTFDSLLSNLDTAVNVPLDAALSALDAAESAAQTGIDTAGRTLDATLGTAQRAIDGFVATFQALVDGAGDAITALRSLVSGARAQIMPPIDALVSLVEQLQSIFQTGVNLLTAFVDTAHAALDAIPAASLPKAAVQPAITAINAALDAVLPVIQTAAKTAGDQLTNLGSTLASQVQTAEQTGLSAVTTFVSTLTQQLEGILPPLREQLAGVQTQIDQAIDQALIQVDQATTAAIDAIAQTFQLVGTQAQNVATAAGAQLDAAEAQLEQAVANARSQIATQRDALAARASELLARIAANIDRAESQLDTTAQQIETGLSQARKALEAQLAAALATLEPRIDTVRAQLAQLPQRLDQGLQPVAAQNRALIAEVTRLLPSSTDIDGAVTKLAQPLSAAADALDQELSRL